MSSERHSANPVGTAPPLLNDRYELGERLAEGTFFYTHRGRDVETGRVVAIKVLKPEYAGDETFSGRLLSEAKAAAGLHHPNIAQVYDAWRERGTVVIITEWVRGINLEERIRRVAPFPVAVAMDILQACAEGLHYAHENGFIHGDIRPDNVIITPDGRVKITDFGVGISIAASTRIQLTALQRAAYYLAPELVDGHAPDTRTDVYSLGCMLYEMLAGEVPFGGEAPIAVAVKHLHEPVPSLKKVNPAVPNAVDGMVQKCLQKDPMTRYLVVKGLLRDVDAVQEAIRNNRSLNWSPLKGTMESAPVPDRKKQRPRVEPEADSGPSGKLLAGVALLGLVMIAGFFLAVTLIFRAPGQVMVPANLVGLPQPEAVALLSRAGLKADVRQEYHERVPVGIVFETAPKGGVELRAGRTVILYTSRGSQPVSVPDVVGKDLPAAQKEIKATGLALGQTREEFSEVTAAGKVISQVPTGGFEAPKKSVVNLVVSKGPEPILTPRVPEETQRDETAPDFRPDRGTDRPSDSGPADTTDTWNPSPDTDSAAPGEPERREHVIEVQIPRRSIGPQTVQIVVRNEDGSEQTVYEQDHQPGEKVEETVTTLGAKGKCQIRVYLNGKLVKSTHV